MVDSRLPAPYPSSLELGYILVLDLADKGQNLGFAMSVGFAGEKKPLC
jgi:hypothetical protein